MPAGRTSPPGRPPQRRRPVTGLGPRRAAYDVLRAVDERDAYANLVLPGVLRERSLDDRDAALATELAYGTLRMAGTLDAILERCVSRPLSTAEPRVRDVLRLGAYQLLRTRIPAHAAVSATVDLARTTAGQGPAKFVNAVLRRVGDRDLDGWLAEIAPAYDEDPVAHLAVVHAHPAWVVSSLRDALGGDLAETAAALEADNLRPQVHLVARPPGLSREALLAEAGSAGEPGPWSPYAVRLAEGDPAGLGSVRSGAAAVQDEGSQLCAVALAAAPLDGPDGAWLDMCAGPGGKAGLLAGLAAERDAALLAAEVAPHRAGLVARSLRHSPGRSAVVAADSRTSPWRAGAFDRVLLDAPCTGLGALRRRPEARWRRRPADIPGLTALQRDLLGAGVDALRPGGLLAYVTCSPHLAETRVPVDDAVRRHGVELLDARPLFPGVPDLGDGPTVQLWPHRQGTDAMFCALIRG